MRHASLPMYDLPGLRQATTAWWVGLSNHFKALGILSVPRRLSLIDGDPYDHWASEDLFFSQTCGYPLTHKLKGKATLLGTPCYDAPGCEGPNYRSLIIVREDCPAETLADLYPARLAINGYDSQSGWNALRPLAEDLGGWQTVFRETLVSGGHAASINWVRESKADVAAIDCVSLALIMDTAPDRLSGIRVMGETAPAPGLPYITATSTPPDEVQRMRQGLMNAVRDPTLNEVRQALRIGDVAQLPLGDYENTIGN